MNHEIAHGPVWHVMVFTEGAGREDYWHRDKSDIMWSIETTWRKVRNTIEIVETSYSIHVYEVSTGEERGTLLLHAMRVHSLPVLEGPTHY